MAILIDLLFLSEVNLRREKLVQETMDTLLNDGIQGLQ